MDIRSQFVVFASMLGVPEGLDDQGKADGCDTTGDVLASMLGVPEGLNDQGKADGCDTMGDVAMDEEGEEEQVDLELMLAPLSRESLELIIVKFIATNPENIGFVEQEVEKPVDMNTVMELLNSAQEEGGVVPAVSHLTPLVTRARDYAKNGDPRNASTILETMTPTFVQLCQEGIPEKETVERKDVDAFFASLEDAWVQTIAVSASTSTSKPAETQSSSDGDPVAAAAATAAGAAAHGKGLLKDFAVLQEWFKQLAEWRTSLSKELGPIFSDPLRTLKKKMKTTMKAMKAAGVTPPGLGKNKAPPSGPQSEASSRPAKRAKK